jgi:hypothetical protein
MQSTQTYNSLPRNRMSGLRGLNDLDLGKSEEEIVPPPSIPPPTTKYWTSDETRRKEYAKIDRHSKGLRGIWNKMMPKFVRTNTGSKFYDEEDDGSDAGSVRRFRLNLPPNKP